VGWIMMIPVKMRAESERVRRSSGKALV